jgi:hypothetical protein
VASPSTQKLSQNTKTELLSVNDSRAHFSVPNAEFEGGGDGHGIITAIAFFGQTSPTQP